ncbi:uncharacterized protein LOC125238873 [Leguminivora glycinivorella]|uniref:uncharacterized protein LOC125238873 n=1 Tax=Leguminivora glycinivorella TaxID=1035111 RepID=UPI00200ED026|nr:uncharacterized protein LOC125238873 [Leguminivora glycinivorella]
MSDTMDRGAIVFVLCLMIFGIKAQLDIVGDLSGDITAVEDKIIEGYIITSNEEVPIAEGVANTVNTLETVDEVTSEQVDVTETVPESNIVENVPSIKEEPPLVSVLETLDTTYSADDPAELVNTVTGSDKLDNIKDTPAMEDIQLVMPIGDVVSNASDSFETGTSLDTVKYLGIIKPDIKTIESVADKKSGKADKDESDTSSNTEENVPVDENISSVGPLLEFLGPVTDVANVPETVTSSDIAENVSTEDVTSGSDVSMDAANVEETNITNVTQIDLSVAKSDSVEDAPINEEVSSVEPVNDITSHPTNAVATVMTSADENLPVDKAENGETTEELKRSLFELILMKRLGLIES